MSLIEKISDGCMPQISNESYRLNCFDTDDISGEDYSKPEEKSEEYQQVSAESYRL
jgi:hypothetical protein